MATSTTRNTAGSPFAARHRETDSPELVSHLLLSKAKRKTGLFQLSRRHVPNSPENIDVASAACNSISKNPAFSAQ